MAAFIREQMRGVIVHPDGIETRELLAFGVPKVRRLQWSQIDRVALPKGIAAAAEPEAKPKTDTTIRLDLWDGSRMWLPEVSRPIDLAFALEKVALARAIPLEGSTGLLSDIEDSTA